MIKYCAKCQTRFECKADDILNCHCQAISLNDHQIESLKQQYDDCLCSVCLKAVETPNSNNDSKVNGD